MLNPSVNGKIQGLFKTFECFSSTFQGKFNFQGLFLTVLYMQVLSSLCELCTTSLMISTGAIKAYFIFDCQCLYRGSNMSAYVLLNLLNKFSHNFQFYSVWTCLSRVSRKKN